MSQRAPRADASEWNRRVTACVLSCEGIPTEQLERGVLVRLVAACIHVEDPRIREIIEEMIPSRRSRRGLSPASSRAGASPKPVPSRHAS